MKIYGARPFISGSNIMNRELPVMHTDRLILRSFMAEDKTQLVDLLRNPHISQMLGSGFVPYPYTITDAEQYISRHKQDTFDSQSIAFAIFLKESPKLIGNVQIRVIDKNKGRLSYWIGEEFCGNGYATEAVLHVLRKVFSMTELNFIEADHFKDNIASGRVLEKCGFHRAEALDRDEKLYYTLSAFKKV